jgi:hypothetical protein
MTSILLAAALFANVHLQPGLLKGDKDDRIQVIVTYLEQPTAEDIKAVEELPAKLVRKLPILKAAVYELRRGQVEAVAKLKGVKSIHANGGVSPGLPPQDEE